MALFLIGGGWAEPALGAHLRAFLADCRAERPEVACLVLDEGDGAGAEQFERFAEALTSAGPCRPVPVLVPLGGELDPAALGTAHGLLVCGGLTPAYADAVAPAAAAVRDWLDDGDRPYAGFSAGAAIAARRAVVGGWRSGGVPVCPEEAGEDLEEVAVVDGLALLPVAVDVHCAQWGTLPRLLAAVGSTPDLAGVALDEGTMLHVDGAVATVRGTGHAWWVTSAGTGVTVQAFADGEEVPVPGLR